MNARVAGQFARRVEDAIVKRDRAIADWYHGDLEPSMRTIALATDIPVTTVARIIARTSPTKETK